MKHVTLVAAVLVLSAGVSAVDNESDPRATVERYLAAALAGKVEDAVSLAVEGQSPGRKERVEEFKSLVKAKSVKIPTIWADEKKERAVAVSEAVVLTRAQPDGRDKGHLVFALVKSKQKWLVRDIDFRSEENAKEQVERFKKKNPDAKELPVKSKG